MALADIYWEVGPILDEKSAHGLDQMRQGLAQKWSLYDLESKHLSLGALEALHIVGDKPSIKSYIEGRLGNFGSLALTGNGAGGLCCTGSVSHAGISQVSSLTQKLGRGFIKAPHVVLDATNRQILAGGIGATMTTRCRIQVFRTKAVGAMRDDLQFFLEHDLAIPGSDFLINLRESGFLRSASPLKADRKPKGSPTMVNV